MYQIGDVWRAGTLTFDSSAEARQECLLVRLLAAGGKALAKLVVVAAVFLPVQDTTGIAIAMLLGEHPSTDMIFELPDTMKQGGTFT